jgi:hypothetical protein
MNRLGYTKFVAQGGDWGGLITEVLAAQAPPGLLGVHTNFPGTVPPDVEIDIQSGSPPPASLSAEERHAYEQLEAGSKQRGYARDGDAPTDDVRIGRFTPRTRYLDA